MADRADLSIPSSISSAAQHFDTVAEEYERSRPDYPPAAVRFLAATLALGPGTRVVDLAAGTGKLSRALRPTGVQLTAIEPLPRMREIYSRELPGVRVEPGVADSIPLPGAFADVVATGQAFHWFSTRTVVAEVARVLVERGAFVLVWNKRDQSVNWVRRFTELIDPYRGDTPTYRSDEWKAAFEEGPFEPLDHRAFRFVQVQDRRGVVDRALSVSFIAALSAEKRQEVVRGVEALLDTDPETAGREEIAFPYETSVYWCRKRRSD